MRIFIVFCTVAILSGCISSTVPVANTNAVPVHESMWKTEKYRDPGENTGLLLIKRDTGFRGSACVPGISIDGEDIAPIDVGQKLELHLNPGQYLLRATPNFNCAARVAEILVEIGAANTTSYRLSFINKNMVWMPSAD